MLLELVLLLMMLILGSRSSVNLQNKSQLQLAERAAQRTQGKHQAKTHLLSRSNSFHIVNVTVKLQIILVKPNSKFQ